MRAESARNAEDDRRSARDAKLAEDKRAVEEQAKIDTEKRANHGKALSDYAELENLAGFRRPDNLNLDTLTPSDVVRMQTSWADSIKQDHPEMSGMSAKNINTMILMKKAIEGMLGKSGELASLGVGAEGGLSGSFRMPDANGAVAGKGIVTGDSPLTNATSRIITREGLSIYGSDGKILSEAQALDNYHRWKTWKPLNGIDKKNYQDSLQIMRLANELNAMRDANVPGKPFATNIAESVYRAKSDQLRDLIIRLRTGAAMNIDEPKLSKRFTLQLGQLQRNQTAAIDEIMEFYGNGASYIETQNRMSPEQVRALRATMLSGVQGVPRIEMNPNEYDQVFDDEEPYVPQKQ
jgi:hypothetical protein